MKMKNILIILTTIIFSFSCTTIEYIDPWENITLKVNSSTNPDHLSNTEIVKQATAVQNFNDKHDMPGDNIWTYTITNDNRKPESNEFLFPGTFVFNVEGALNSNYIKSTNILLVREITAPDAIAQQSVLDTIAFIPSNNISTARKEIERAFIEKRAVECYTIFEEMMVFTPITGAEFNKLKQSKLN